MDCLICFAVIKVHWDKNASTKAMTLTYYYYFFIKCIFLEDLLESLFVKSIYALNLNPNF